MVKPNHPGFENITEEEWEKRVRYEMETRGYNYEDAYRMAEFCTLLIISHHAHKRYVFG